MKRRENRERDIQMLLTIVTYRSIVTLSVSLVFVRRDPAAPSNLVDLLRRIFIASKSSHLMSSLTTQALNCLTVHLLGLDMRDWSYSERRRW